MLTTSQEIHWQGGSCVGFAEESVGKDWRRTKEYRIMPVAYLPDMRSLDTLVIFIDESPMRRPWEDKSMVRHAVKATEGQPNHREKRQELSSLDMDQMSLTSKYTGLCESAVVGTIFTC